MEREAQEQHMIKLFEQNFALNDIYMLVKYNFALKARLYPICLKTLTKYLITYFVLKIATAQSWTLVNQI